MSDPRVTILVPTIGRVEYLAHTRDSISAQTHRDFEILVLDNASPAESRSLLDEWASRDDRVRVLRVDERIPMFPNFNRGIEAARGEYFTFVHDDDVVAPEFLARHVAFLDAHPRVGFSGSNFRYIGRDGDVLERRSPVRATEVWSGRRYIRTLLRRGRNPLTMQSIFYRRCALGGAGLDTSISLHYGDFVFLMRLAEKWDVGLVAEPLVDVRNHVAQASASLALSRGMEMRRDILAAYVEELAQKWPGERRFIGELRASLAIAHRTGLLWGWAVAADDAEARACVHGLGVSPLDRGLGLALRGLDRLAPPASRPRSALIRAARRLANG